MEYSANQFVNDLNHFIGDYKGSHKCERALHKGMESGNINFCKTLLHPAFIKDLEYEHGWLTPLMLASKFGYTDLVMILIKMGANIEKVTTNGNIALSTAIINGKDLVVDILIKNGANINVYDPCSKTTALMCAVDTKKTSIIKTLIDKGANINAVNIAGVSALMIAAGHEDPEYLKILINNGADIYNKNIDGKTALDWAKMFRRTENIKILEEENKKLQYDNKKCSYGYACLNLAKGICMLEHNN